MIHSWSKIFRSHRSTELLVTPHHETSVIHDLVSDLEAKQLVDDLSRATWAWLTKS